MATDICYDGCFGGCLLMRPYELQCGCATWMTPTSKVKLKGLGMKTEVDEDSRVCLDRRATRACSRFAERVLYVQVRGV